MPHVTVQIKPSDRSQEDLQRALREAIRDLELPFFSLETVFPGETEDPHKGLFVFNVSQGHQRLLEAMQGNALVERAFLAPTRGL